MTHIRSCCDVTNGLAGAVVIACAAVACQRDARDITPHAPEIDAYVAFLTDADRVSPVDYVLRLFDEADVVVLCERFHPEVTQYDLILRIISDPRFIERVGHVFTEIGAITAAPEIERFLTAEGQTDAERDAWRMRIYRDFSEEVFWGRFNYYDMLGRVYDLNQTLPRDRKVHIHPVGLPFTWRGMTHQAYRAYMSSKGDRDHRMAQHVVEGLRQIAASRRGPAKALVIMNYRHAFPHLVFPNGDTLANTTGYLLEKLPGRVRNVMLNSVAITGGTSEADMQIGLVQEGRWDAAFAVTGNRPVGFDFADSPFGADAFDFFPFGTDGLTYADIFTGFVFYEPVSRHRHVDGVPGIVDDAFALELRRRMEIARDYYGTAEEREAYLASSGGVDTSTYESHARIPVPFEQQMRRWMNAHGP
jgi:hypothetical protein